MSKIMSDFIVEIIFLVVLVAAACYIGLGGCDNRNHMVALDNRTLETFIVIKNGYQLNEKFEPGDVIQVMIRKGETTNLELRYIDKLDFMPTGISILSFQVVDEYKAVKIIYKRIGNGEIIPIAIPEMREPKEGFVAPSMEYIPPDISYVPLFVS